MADINAIIDQLSSLTVMEAADLVKKLEEKWGVSAAAAVAVAAGPAAAAAPAEEKTEFTVVLAKAGEKKIDSAGVMALAKMPGLNELRATILSMLNQPATKLLRTIKEPGGALARVIKAKSEKQ